MYNTGDPKQPQVILPFKYLEEVKNAPENKLSFRAFSKRMVVLPAAAGPLQTDEATHIVKLDMNRALKWTPVQPYQILLYVVARITTRVLTGPEMCDNEKWIDNFAKKPQSFFGLAGRHGLLHLIPKPRDRNRNMKMVFHEGEPTSPQFTMQRVAVDGWTFKDGFHLPRGTPILFPLEQLNLDTDVHPEADSFDAKRWLRRFYAQEALKLMLIHLLTNYDFKHATEGMRRPPDIRQDLFNMPDTGMPLLFKRTIN
ncbi:hypothetical protein DL768_010382 [Monosporascus sp. mg162]|nr:hypothetical protein DL768_010382 [Monosporascus sp. mg162]